MRTRNCWTLTACFALTLAPIAARAQEPATVSGTVTNPTGTPIGGASVFVEELRIGSTTDERGHFSFIVPAARVTNAPATVTARLIGFKPLSRTVVLASGPIVVDFNLASAPVTLSEVVVTGAGLTSTREASGNVTNTVKADLIQRANEPNVISALAAKAPNVYVSSQSGEPGASSYISIRGAKTITGTGQPLIVVDGVPIDNSTNSTSGYLGGTVASNRAADLNPNDVESVEILKGAAAGAIYGSRAGQGVVLITTKSGHGTTRYSLNSTSTWDKVNHEIPLQRKFGQRTTCGTTPGCRGSSDSYGPALAAGTPTYDHFTDLLRTGNTFDNVLSASGGNDRQSFYLSGGRTDQNGTIKGPYSYYDRTTFLVKASQKIFNKLTIGGTANYADVRMGSVQKGSNISGLMLGSLRTPPEFDNSKYKNAFGYHRSYRYPNPIGASDQTATRGYDNPYWVVNEDPATSDVNRTFGNVNLNYDPMDWLNARYTLGGDYSADDRLESLVPSSSSYPTGIMYRADYINYQIDHNLLVTAKHSVTDNINASLTLGQNLNSRNYRQRYVIGRTFIAPEGPFNLSNMISLEPDEQETLIHLESYFGQATVDLFDQLFLTGTLRNDGNSTFSKSQRRFWYPKGSVAWTFTKATDVATSFLEYGKLRAAYGETGKEPPVYAIFGGYSFDNTSDEGWGPYLRTIQNSRGGMTSQSRAAQEKILPERQKEFEAGVDLGFARQLGDLSVTYYNSRSSDVIFETPRSPSSGYTTQLQNAAEISNKGVEVSLNLNPVSMQNFAWDVGLQWAKNKNLVTSLSGIDHVDIGGAFEGTPGTVMKGHAVGVFRGYDFIRCRYGETNMADLNGDGVPDDVNAACRTASAPNGALYITASGFPDADPTSRVLADPNPKWLGSVRTGITLFKKWQIAGLLDIKKGGDVWNGTRGALYNFGTHKDTEIRNTPVVFGTTYRPGATFGPGKGTSVTLTRTNWWQDLGSGFGPVASQFMEDGGYVKLREISVAYTLDQPFVKDWTSLSSINVRVAGRNLRTWTKYTGIDPETNLAGAEVLLRGVDYFNNPQTRSVVLTVGLNR